MVRRLAAALVLFVGGAALASGLEVAPTSVELGTSNQTALIRLKNGGDQATRYQLELKGWSESSSGQMQLSPTRDVVFFPQLLTLGPGESRNVRVGITHPAGATEQTYRLFVQELPSQKKPGARSEVQVLTRVGIPVFVVPAQPFSKVELTPFTVQAGKASLGLTNHGNAHARPGKVVFTAADAQGNPVFEKSWSGWYLLAGGERDYSVQLPAKDCQRATSFRVEALGEKLSLSKTIQAAKGACGP